MFNKKTKIAAGTSGAGILLLIFHFWHVAHTITKIGEPNESDAFKNTPVFFIQTDSAGKKDTVMMEDYLKKQK